MDLVKDVPTNLTTEGLIATVLFTNGTVENVEKTKSIDKAAFLISKISIFQMDPQLVHSFAVLDCMLHGQVPVNSWEPAITILDKLKSGNCPKKAVLEEAKELLLTEQMAVAMKSPPLPPPWATPKSATDVSAAFAKSMSQTFVSNTPFTTSKATPPKAFDTSKPNYQQIPNTSTSSPKVVDFGAIKGCAIQVHAHGIFVKTPFNPQFVAALKTLPVSDRKWDSVKKVWVVSIGHKDWIVNLMEQTFPGKVQELTA